MEWKALNCGLAPSPREMHASVAYQNVLLISGGRSEDGPVLSDIWVLSLIPQTFRDVSGCPLKWERMDSMNLPSGRCAHSCSIVEVPNNVDGYELYLMILGGFEEGGIASTAMTAKLLLLEREGNRLPFDATETEWIKVNFIETFGLRFGHAICGISQQFMDSLLNNDRYRPLFLSKPDIQERLSQLKRDPQFSKEKRLCGIVVFGGVNIEQDFGDLWVLFP